MHSLHKTTYTEAHHILSAINKILLNQTKSNLKDLLKNEIEVNLNKKILC